MVRFCSWAARWCGPWPLAIATLIAASVVALAATPVAAHASLLSSSPPDGAAVVTAPTKVELIFSEDVGAPSIIAVTGPDGIPVVDGSTQTRNASAVQPLKSLTSAGLYKIAYRVVSADGHPVSGQLTFTYAPPGSDVRVSDQERSAQAKGALGGHGAHLVALGILVLAAVLASVVALRKDRQYKQAAVDSGPQPVRATAGSDPTDDTGQRATGAPTKGQATSAEATAGTANTATANTATANTATADRTKK